MPLRRSALVMLLGVLASCSIASSDGGDGGDGGAIQHVFVIAFENHDQKSIIGNRADAKYINDTLLPSAASSQHFTDLLPIDVPSEPHYVWMEAGTNAFVDHVFSDDGAPSAANSTKSTAHLSTQLEAAGKSWRAYQEGLDAATGDCPIASSGFYQPKHDPFVFFQDVSGSPPSKTHAYCVAHHKALSALAGDLRTGDVASYIFITPDQCHDMHGQTGCPNSNKIQAGDEWLKSFLPPLIAFASEHHGVIFLVWDEGESTTTIPFLALGPDLKVGYASATAIDHSSLVKTIEELFGLPTLERVQSANDFADLFQHGLPTVP